MKIDETNRKNHRYPVYGRQFISHRWFKPLFVAALGFIFYIIATFLLLGFTAAGSGDFSDLMDMLDGGYDTMDVTSFWGIVLSLGGVAIMLPSLLLAVLIVRDRPFSSYSSARGGWDWSVFGKCMLLALLTIGIPIAVFAFIEGDKPENKFTMMGFIALTIIGPLQCVAEEYVFRGLLMQTLGSWVRVPVIAVILQAAVFASQHPYDMKGVISIVVSGLVFGLTAWIGRGIEVSSAMHIVNNMTIFYGVGLGMMTISSDTDMTSLIFDICIAVAYLIAVIIADRKFHWFDNIRRDDAAEWNARVEAKRAKKAARKAAKYEARHASK